MIRFLRPFALDRLRLLVFDLDGTLIDSRLDLIHSVNAALRHIGRPELDGDVIASYVGDGAPVLMRRALGDIDDETLLVAALEYFLSYYRIVKHQRTDRVCTRFYIKTCFRHFLPEIHRVVFQFVA